MAGFIELSTISGVRPLTYKDTVVLVRPAPGVPRTVLPIGLYYSDGVKWMRFALQETFEIYPTDAADFANPVAITTVTADYTALKTDTLLQVYASATLTITLPEPDVFGPIKFIKDAGGNSTKYPITVLGKFKGGTPFLIASN